MQSVRFSGIARRFAASLLILFFAACAAPLPTYDTENIDRVLVLIGQRLGYMDDVARNKWNSGAPIEDLPREREIIDSLGKQAPEYGLDPAIARDFFRSQIEASKIIQRTRFAEWRAQKQPPFKNMPDLRDTIRPALDALTPKLMKSLAAAMPLLRGPDAAAIAASRADKFIQVRDPDRLARDEAISPLLRAAKNR
jgi:chorismate mutase